MPFPPDLPDREEPSPPDLPEPNLETANLILNSYRYLHYAIKGPENQSTETIF